MSNKAFSFHLASLTSTRQLNPKIKYLRATAGPHTSGVVEAIFPFGQIRLRRHFVNTRCDLFVAECARGFIHRSALRAESICLRDRYFASVALVVKIDQNKLR